MKYQRIPFIVIIIFLQAISQIASLLRLDLSFSDTSSKYYLKQNYLGSQYTQIELSIDTSISTSLINSIHCDMCKQNGLEQYDPTTSKDHQLILLKSSYIKRNYIYNGPSYEDTYLIDNPTNPTLKLKGKLSFISIDSIDNMARKNLQENGLISLSYYSDFFTIANEKHIIVTEFNTRYGAITIGGIDTKRINTTLLVYFPISLDNTNYIWYLESSKVVFYNKTKETSVVQSQKIMVDSTTWQVHIPRNFFYKYMKEILPLSCQVQTSGLFYCHCSMNNMTYFPHYNFTFGSGNLTIKPNDYLQYEPITGMCIAFINLNYWNDYWVIGLNVLNNYMTVFDYENKQMAFYSKQMVTNDLSTFFIIIVSVGVGSSLILFGGYILYKKCWATQQNQLS